MIKVDKSWRLAWMQRGFGGNVAGFYPIYPKLIIMKSKFTA
jgi:hypothetical protein